MVAVILPPTSHGGPPARRAFAPPEAAGHGGACLEVNMPVRTVDPATASIWIKEATAILVDVREPAEYRAAHIPQARLIPLSEVDIDRLPAGKKIVIHCAKGGRGQTACEKLLQQNSSLEIFNLAGGIEGWAAAGLPRGTGNVKRCLAMSWSNRWQGRRESWMFFRGVSAGGGPRVDPFAAPDLGAPRHGAAQ